MGREGGAVGEEEESGRRRGAGRVVGGGGGQWAVVVVVGAVPLALRPIGLDLLSVDYRYVYFLLFDQ